MGRVGLLGRIMLVLLGALSLLVIATFGIDRWQRNHERSPYPSRFPRVDQAAHIVSLLRDADPAQRPAILKAVSGEALKAEIVAAPPDEAGLIREPRLEARLIRIAGEPAGRIRAFTDAAMLHRGVDPAEPAAARRGPVGRLAAATYRLPDGQTLVVTVIEGHRSHMPWLLGQPLSLWVAVLGVAVAGLVTLGARHELAPLRRLTEAVARFDGRAPTPSPAAHQGAPEIRRLAQAIQAMQERIAGLMGERSLLIGAISHDLKTYLTRMRLRAEGVAEAGRRERLVEDLDAMTALIETSLSFARGTAAEIGRSPVDLADIVAVEVAEHAAQGAPVSLTGEEVRNATVAGDAVALRRVVANLVGNAVEYGRSSVAVAVRRTGAACQIVVEDDGPGIPEAERAAVFSPYYRVERSRSRQTGGSGLGLAIARQIAEAHGGSIVAEAAASGGARIVVTLPALA